MKEQYILGHHEAEWDRLTRQHALWGPTLLGPLAAMGIEGKNVLELGCGPGDLLEDLAGLSGRTVHALERDPAAAARAAQRLGPRAEVRVGDILEAPLGGPHDLIVARWVLSFLPDPGAAVARAAQALAPGGHLVVQDYHHEGFAFFPDEDGLFARGVAGLRRSYRTRGGDPFVAGRLPALGHAAGLRTVEIDPQAMAGGPGSGVWEWIEVFLAMHVGALGLSAEEGATLLARLANPVPGATLFSPTVVRVVLQAPP